MNIFFRDKGDCFYEWFRAKGNGFRERLHSGGMFSSLLYSFLNFLVLIYQLSCCLTRQIHISLAEYLDLTYKDVGGCVELVYTPVRKDGVKGGSRTITSSLVMPGE